MVFKKTFLPSVLLFAFTKTHLVLFCFLDLVDFGGCFLLGLFVLGIFGRGNGTYCRKKSIVQHPRGLGVSQMSACLGEGSKAPQLF